MRQMVGGATLVFGVFVAACNESTPPRPLDYNGPDNVVLVVLDDVGIDKIGRYGVHPEVAPTPTFDQLADEGLLFRNAYALPTCTATRGALLTGRQARRTGAGGIIWPFTTVHELPLNEQTIPELLAQAPVPYRSEMAGKWHLSSKVSPSGTRLPTLQGFDWFAGSMNNLWADTENESGGYGFYEFEKVQPDGSIEIERQYATTDTTDDALDRLGQLAEPFFLVVSYNAAHNPWHTPPNALHSFRGDLSRFDQHLAATEAMDTELGRIIDTLDADEALAARTWVVVIGDNGTPSTVVRAPADADRAKHTVYEGGVRVPMVVRGPGVPAASETASLLHVVDLLPTFAEIAGVSTEAHPGAGPLDGVSQLSVFRDPTQSARGHVFVEALSPSGPAPWTEDEQSVRDARFKLVRHTNGVEELYDLDGFAHDQGEDLLQADLDLDPEAEAALVTLTSALDAHFGSSGPE